MIFEEGEAIELLDDNRKYFEALDRVKLIPRLEPLTLDQFADEFVMMYEDGISYLVVLNTINASLRFYRAIKEKLRDKGVAFFYLSTNIIPRERRKRIQEIRSALQKGKKIIVVSTQVVEAGVDIDLDAVVRDLGPIDSIVQVAGRCNRSGWRDKGRVYVFNLKDSRSYSAMIYGALSTIVSIDVLKGETDENRFYEMINEYFERVKDKKSFQKSDDLIEAMNSFCFDVDDNVECCKLSDFQLIEENRDYVDVFVQVDDEAAKIWDEYEKGVLKEKDFVKRQENYLKVRRDFKDHLVSVPVRVAKDLIRPTKNSSVWLVPLENKEYYYDDETGFKRDIDDEILIF